VTEIEHGTRACVVGVDLTLHNHTTEVQRLRGMLAAAQREARTHKAAAADLASHVAQARREGKVEGLREAAALVEGRSREAVTYRARAILADAANMLTTTAHLTASADAIENGDQS
jgi:hypothetical protein